MDHIADSVSDIFPKKQNTNKQHYISDDTYAIIEYKSITAKAMRQAARRFKFASAKACCLLWKNKLIPVWHKALLLGTRKKIHDYYVHHLAFYKHADEIHAKVHDDYNNHIRRKAAQLEAAADGGDTSQVYRTLREMKPFVPRRQEALIDEDGTVQSSPTGEQQILQRHFAKLTDGQLHNMSHMIAEDRDHANQMYNDSHTTDVDYCNLVTTLDITNFHVKSKAARVVGETGIGPNVYNLT